MRLQGGLQVNPEELEPLWRSIVELHLQAKALILKAEESGVSYQTYIQPALEHRHALEHIVRAQSALLGIGPQRPDSYVEGNLRQAFGHEYRSFFDAAEWICLTARRAIADQLTPYSTQCIAAVLPEYYRSYRPELERIGETIAELRSGKDAHDLARTLEDVRRFRETVIDRLLALRAEIDRHVPSMSEWTQRREEEKARDDAQRRRRTRRAILLTSAASVLSALLGALVTWLLTRPT